MRNSRESFTASTREPVAVTDEPMRISHAGALRGAHSMIGVMPAVFCFGIGFGIAAGAAGMNSEVATAMSALTFAGASQFAALDLWQVSLPWTALVVVTVGVNLRHILYGATLHAWLRQLPRMQRYFSVVLLTDANWITSRQAFINGERDAGYLLGSGAALWVTWLAGTLGGVIAGESIGDPLHWGIDAILPAFFACSLVGMANRWRDTAPWIAAAVVACLTVDQLPGGGHIIAGTFAGGLVGVFAVDRS